MSTADEMLARWNAVKQNKARKKYEQENPYMLITENVEGKPDTLRFKTPSALEEYKRNKYRTLTKEERAAARVEHQSWLPDDPQQNWSSWPGTHQATQDSITIDLKKKPEDQLKAVENAKKLEKIAIEEKYNKYGAKALTDPEGRKMFGEKWEDIKKKSKGPDPGQAILEQNKKIQELDKSLMVKGKDEKGNETEYLNPNYDDIAVATVEKLKTAHKDTLNMAVNDVKFNRFANQWKVEPEYLKTQYNNAKAELARQQNELIKIGNDALKVQRVNEILKPYGFTLETIRMMDNEFAGTE